MRHILNFLEEAVLKKIERKSLYYNDDQYSFSEIKHNSLIISSKIPQYILGQPVAIILPKNPFIIFSILGVLYSGNFYAPIDHKTPLNRILKILEDLNPKIIITDNSYHSLLKDLFKNVLVFNVEDIFSTPLEITYSSTNIQFHKILDIDPAYVIYTSGSTGNPKGVLISHKSVMEYIEWVVDCYKISEEEVIANQSPICFDMSVLDIFSWLKSKSTLHLIPENLFSFPYKILEFLEKKSVSFIFWVPTVLSMIAGANVLDKLIASNLKKILFAGEVMPTKVLNIWKKNYPEAIFSNLYGPTEATVTCTYYIIKKKFLDNEIIPIGYSRDNCNVFLMDYENGELIEDINKEGEICIKGSLLALGYLNDSEKTRKNFIQNPLNKAYPEIVYKTGDIGKYDLDRAIVYLGRKDNQIKHRGHRIDLGEIESIAMSLPDVTQACCLYNHKNSKLMLFFESKLISETELKEKLKDHLPKYMIPEKYFLLEKIPLNQNTKIDRKQLSEKYFT